MSFLKSFTSTTWHTWAAMALLGEAKPVARNRSILDPSWGLTPSPASTICELSPPQSPRVPGQPVRRCIFSNPALSSRLLAPIHMFLATSTRASRPSTIARALTTSTGAGLTFARYRR